MQQPLEIDDSPAEQAVARVAAVDVAKASGVVCTRVPRETGGDGAGPGRFSTKVWTVSATTNAILELADHLTSMAIEKVVLESTSDYWRPFYYLLEAAGLHAELVNARDVKNAPGRPKTDKCAWPGGRPGGDEMLSAARRARSPYPEWSALSPRQVWRRARGTLDCRFEHEPQLRLFARSSPAGCQ
jgi:transposase